MNSARASPRTDSARSASARTDAARASPRAVWNLVAADPVKKVPKLKSMPSVIIRRDSLEGKWLECGCPRSTANRAQKVDLTPRQHAHMVALDESVLHYIFDRRAYLKINQLAPQKPHLKQWIVDRCQEGRLFVAKPPTPPPSNKPWRYDSPPKLGLLQSGWRAWDPQDVALTFSAVNTVEEYNEHLETFFLWLNIGGVVKSEMMESGEAWMLACGEETDHLKVKNRRTCKVDRCFVTCDMEFFELVMAKWDRMSFFTRSIKCGEKMKYMKRLMDIRLDPHRSLFFTGPKLQPRSCPCCTADSVADRISSCVIGEAETRVDSCEMASVVQGHPPCNIHGPNRIRRAIQTAPPPVQSSKLLSPREPPKTRVKKVDAKSCRGTRWCPWAAVEDRPYLLNYTSVGK